MDVFKEAGVPDGVIIFFGDPVMITDTVLDSPDFQDYIQDLLLF